MKRKVILTGGAGFIGGAIAHILVREGFAPLVVDDFSTSHPHKNFPCPVFRVDLKNRHEVDKIWAQFSGALGVIHLAARAVVPESVAQPALYFENNILAALNTIEASLAVGLRNFVHSSTCAIYGSPTQIPIPETHAHAPLSPYGESKWIVERILASYESTKGLKPLNLRYFNPAGALAGGIWGESHVPETHIVPNVVRFGHAGKPIPLYGNDYETPDGTCVRDFIHIEDLAMAHIVALKYVETSAHPVKAINIGTGRGYSVSEVITAAEKLMGKKFTIEVMSKRPGDPPKLIADASLMKKELGFTPKRDLEMMVRSQWEWFRANQ